MIYTREPTNLHANSGADMNDDLAFCSQCAFDLSFNIVVHRTLGEMESATFMESELIEWADTLLLLLEGSYV